MKNSSNRILSAFESFCYKFRYVFGVLFLVLVAATPFMGLSLVNVQLLTLIALYAMLGMGLNVLIGYTGLVSLGHAGFYAIGAYTCALLMTKLSVNFWLALPLAGIFTAFIGFLLGLPSLRLSGSYLSIVTLGFCEIMRIIELNWVELTNGPFGIKQIPAPSLFGFTLNQPVQKYYLAVVLLAIVIVLMHNVINSRTGRAWKSIKSDPIAAQAMGINVFRYKVFAFAICAAIAGLAGVYYASYINYVDSTTFNYNQSIQILSMTIMGGLGSIPGSIIGAVFFVILPEILRWLSTFCGEWIAEWRQILYGLILVLMIMFKSDGILGGFDLRQIRLYNRLHGKAPKAAKEEKV